MSAGLGWFSRVAPNMAEEGGAAAEAFENLLPLEVLRRGIGAGLVGDREQLRNACVKLTEIAHREERLDDRCRWLLVAGCLAREAEELELAASCFREVSDTRGSPSDIVRATRALLAAGRAPELTGTVRQLLDEGTGDGLGWLGPLCEEAGRYDLAEEVYEKLAERDVANAASVDDHEAKRHARRSLARFSLYRLAMHEARAHLERLEAAEEDLEAMRLRATLECLEERPAPALAIIEAIEAKWPEAKSHLEVRLFRAEALLALGRLEAATEIVARVIDTEDSFAARVAKARMQIAEEQNGRGIAHAVRRLVRAIGPIIRALVHGMQRGRHFPWQGLDHRFEPALYQSLSFMTSPERLSRCHGDIGEASRLLEEVNRSLGANRSRLPTRAVSMPIGRARLERWEIPHHARQASALLLKRLTSESPAEVLKGFEALLDEFPYSPFPFTYRGELRLWLGDDSGAFADFESAIRRLPTRWAYIGMSAIHMLHGEEKRAAKLSDLAVKRFGPALAATTYVYRGELRRRRDDFKGALADLELAVAQRPSRVAARMNLALVYAELERHQEAERELRRAIEDVPGILWVTARALGRALPSELNVETARPFLEHAFTLMRGNRSSWCYSLFDEAGRFRVLPPAAGWKKLASRELPEGIAYGPP